MEWKAMHELVRGRVSCLASTKENQVKPMLENEKARWTLGMEWKD
jgi:hypothetical protein